MRKFVRFLILAIALSSLSIFAFVWKTHVDETALWNDIIAHVPSQPFTEQSPDTMTKSNWQRSSFTGKYETGQVTLGNGEVWRYAFASHHSVKGEDCYTVYRNHSDTIRVKGGGYCCELEFFGFRQPVDKQEFLTMLRNDRGVVMEMP